MRYLTRGEEAVNRILLVCEHVEDSFQLSHQQYFQVSGLQIGESQFAPGSAQFGPGVQQSAQSRAVNLIHTRRSITRRTLRAAREWRISSVSAMSSGPKIKRPLSSRIGIPSCSRRVIVSAIWISPRCNERARERPNRRNLKLKDCGRASMAVTGRVYAMQRKSCAQKRPRLPGPSPASLV